MELVVAPIAELRSRLTHFFEDLVGDTLDRGAGTASAESSFACGITGGSAALIFLGALREANVDWPRITLFWGDERAVPPDSIESNYALAEQMLLKPLGARAPVTVRMEAELPDLQYAAKLYARQLPEALNLLILGVGDDGHVCSLFPGHRALLVADAPVVAITDSPKPPPQRLTLTMSYVLRSEHIWIVAVGERKRMLLQQAIAGQAPTTPVELVISQGKAVTVFTDRVLRRNR